MSPNGPFGVALSWFNSYLVQIVCSNNRKGFYPILSLSEPYTLPPLSLSVLPSLLNLICFLFSSCHLTLPVSRKNLGSGREAVPFDLSLID